MIWLRKHLQKMILNDNFHEAGSWGWSFARGLILLMIICKRPDPPYDHLQMAGPSRWSFARGWIHWMIICKRLAPPDDHLQVAGPSWWSFARGQRLWMIICKSPVPSDNNNNNNRVDGGPAGWPGGPKKIWFNVFESKQTIERLVQTLISPSWA